MVMEAPVQLLGQVVVNGTANAANALLICSSGANTRGIVLRSCIIAVTSPPGLTDTASLVADINITGAFFPPLPPIGMPSTTRYILQAGISGSAQLAGPVYLEPGLGLVCGSSGAASFNVYATWDYAAPAA